MNNLDFWKLLNMVITIKKFSLTDGVTATAAAGRDTKNEYAAQTLRTMYRNTTRVSDNS